MLTKLFPVSVNALGAVSCPLAHVSKQFAEEELPAGLITFEQTGSHCIHPYHGATREALTGHLRNECGKTPHWALIYGAQHVWKMSITFFKIVPGQEEVVETLFGRIEPYLAMYNSKRGPEITQETGALIESF